MANLTGTAGNDTLTGGDGNDSLSGADGSDLLIGGNGDDSFSVSGKTGQWADTIEGGNGTDRVVIDLPGIASPADFSSLQAAADDTLGAYHVLTDANGNSITLVGVEEVQIGSDVYTISQRQYDTGHTYSDYLYAKTGTAISVIGFEDSVASEGINPTFFQIDTGDTLSVIGTRLGDRMSPDGGASIPSPAAWNSDYLLTNDYFDGRGGNDTISGQFGLDTLLGGDGNDFLAVYDGNDSIDAGAGNDEVYIAHAHPADFVLLDGGAGTDTLSAAVADGGTVDMASYSAAAANFEAFKVIGYGQSLTVLGTDDADAMELNVTSSTASLAGGAGDDTISIENYSSAVTVDGGAGDDQIFNDGSASHLLGGAGRDTLLGGATSDDTLDGGAGRDYLLGEGGSDIFVIRSGDSNGETADADVIGDFTRGTDKIGLDGLAYSELSFTDGAGSYAGRTIVSVADTGEVVVVLKNIAAADLSADDFIALTDPLPGAQEAPTGRDFTVTMDEDTRHTFSGAEFSFRDTDPLDALTAVVVQTLPENGSLTLDGIAVTAGDRISAAAIAAGQLVFEPAHNANGAAYASFAVRLEDPEGLLSADVNVGIDVTPVNDPPGMAHLSGDTVPENAPGAVIGLLSSMDADGDPVSFSLSDDRFEVVDDYLKLKDGIALDFETEPEVSLLVTASDSADGHHYTYVNLHVLDRPEYDGAQGPDFLTGTDGADRMEGNSGNDSAFGGGGADTIGGGIGRDRLGGGTGDDALDGGDGKDTLWGGQGDDSLTGGAGDDLLFNGAGSDVAFGGTGNDTLWAGQGDDTLTGGEGADTFLFGKASGHDTITDFNADEDTLDLGYLATRFESAADVVAAATAQTEGGQSGVLLDLGDGNSVFLEGVALQDLASLHILI